MIQAVADYFKVPLTQILGSSRQKEYRTARQVAMYLIREVLGVRLETIGQIFSKNHATVLHSCRKVEEGLQQNTALVRQVNAVKQGIGL